MAQYTFYKDRDNPVDPKEDEPIVTELSGAGGMPLKSSTASAFSAPTTTSLSTLGLSKSVAIGAKTTIPRASSSLPTRAMLSRASSTGAN